MSKKKKTHSNDKFNFEDDYIIGISKPNDSKKENGNKAKNENTETIRIEKKQTDSETEKGNYRLLKILLCICAVLLLIILLRFSPTFNISSIVIENNSFVSSEEIEELSGISKGMNLFSINKKQVAKKIEESPYIADVEIYRALPNTLRIVVHERTERYVVQYVEGKFAILDGQGYILEISDTPKELVSLAGLESNFEELAARREHEGNVRLNEVDLKKLDMVAKIVDTAKSYDVLGFITAIDVANASDIKLNLAGEGKVAYIGSGSDLNSRIQFMKVMLDGEKGKSGIMFINVDFSKDDPFFRENV